MNSPQTTRALAHNTMLQIVGKGIGMVLGILTVAVMLRYFGDTGYGAFTTAVTFLSLFAVVVDFGLTLTTVQMISEPSADEPKILGNMMALRLLTGCIVFAAAPIIALAFPYSNEIKLAIAVGSLAYFFSSTGQMLVGIYQKRLLMMRVVIAELVSRAILLIGVLIVVATRAHLIEVIIALVIANFAQTALLLILAKPFVRVRSQMDFGVWKEIIRRSWPIGISIFFNLIYLRGDIIILSLLKPEADVGLYGGAYKVIDVITVLPVMFMGMVLPLLVDAWKRRDQEAFQATMQKSFDFFSMIALPIMVGALTLADAIMVLVGGDEFASAGPILRVLAPAAAVVFYGSLFGHAIVAVDKQKFMTIGYAVTSVISITAYLLLIPTLGVTGAAWVTLFSESLVMLLTYLVVQRTSGIKLQLTITAKVIAACLVMYLFLRLAPHLHLLLQVLMGAIVYFVVLVALGGVKPKTLRSLFGSARST